ISNASDVNVRGNIVLNSSLDNIRVTGGSQIKISDNICANAGNINICVVPVQGLSINEVYVNDNICYDLNGDVKPKEKRVLSSNANNVTIQNNKFVVSASTTSVSKPLSADSCATLQFVSKRPISGYFEKGQVFLKLRDDQTLIEDKVLGWECIQSGSPGKWKTIEVNI